MVMLKLLINLWGRGAFCVGWVAGGFAQIDVQNKGFLCKRHFCTRTSAEALICRAIQSHPYFN